MGRKKNAQWVLWAEYSNCERGFVLPLSTNSGWFRTIHQQYLEEHCHRHSEGKVGENMIERGRGQPEYPRKKKWDSRNKNIEKRGKKEKIDVSGHKRAYGTLYW